MRTIDSRMALAWALPPVPRHPPQPTNGERTSAFIDSHSYAIDSLKLTR